MAEVGRGVAEAALGLVGVPFRHGGRDRRGLDCAGLVLLSLRLCGASMPDPEAYSPNPTPEAVRGSLVQQAVPLREGSERTGDVALLRHGGKAVHLGVLAGESIVHASRVVGRVVATPRRLLRGPFGVEAYYRPRWLWHSPS